MRNDLQVGFAAAQIVHAAGESSPGNLNQGTYAVVLSVETEEQLRGILRALTVEGLPCVPIFEPDQPWDGQLTAIGLMPVGDRSKIKKIVSGLPLYGKNKDSLRVVV